MDNMAVERTWVLAGIPKYASQRENLQRHFADMNWQNKGGMVSCYHGARIFKALAESTHDLLGLTGENVEMLGITHGFDNDSFDHVGGLSIRTANGIGRIYFVEEDDELTAVCIDWISFKENPEAATRPTLIPKPATPDSINEMLKKQGIEAEHIHHAVGLDQFQFSKDKQSSPFACKKEDREKGKQGDSTPQMPNLRKRF